MLQQHWCWAGPPPSRQGRPKCHQQAWQGEQGAAMPHTSAFVLAHDRSSGYRRRHRAARSWWTALACLHLVVATASAHEPPSSQASYHDGRLVVLDHYRLDGTHSQSYVLHTPADELLSVVALGQELEDFKTNDAVRLWLKEAGADSSSSSSSGSTEQANDDTAAHGGSRRAAAEDEPSAQSYVVQRVQALPKSWFIPGDSASIWGDSTTWDAEDPILADDDGDGSSNGTHAASPPPPPGRVGQGENELAAIIAQGLAPSSSSSAALTAPGSATAQILALPYTRTTKVVSDMSMIIYVMDICGKGGGPATTATAVSTKVINQTLGPYVSACSRDIGLVSPSNTRVLDVKLDCSGALESTGDKWTYGSCSGDNLMRLAYAADEYAETVAGINPRKFRHHVLVLPRRANEWMGSTCNWAGTAVLGFSSPAWTYLWIAGEVWDSPQLYLHEMGHNYMLGHSNRLRAAATRTNPLAEPEANVLSHGDMTSAMGYCCQMRCFHAPHAWQMGWSQAVAALDSTQLTPGTTLQFFIPPQLSARRNFITVTTNWVPPPPPAPPPVPAPPQPSPPPSGIIHERLSAANPLAEEGSRAEESSLVDYMAVGEDSERSPEEIVLVSVNATTMQHDQSVPAGPQASSSPIVQTEVFPSPHTFWLSWRPRALPYDLPVPDYQDALLIHLYDGRTQSDALETFEQGQLTPGSGPNQTAVWRDVAYGSGLVVRLINSQPASGSSGGAGGAWVSVCRASHQSEKGLCNDGLDNDCNGLTDAEDPACQRGATPPPGARARTSGAVARGPTGLPSPPQRGRRRRRALHTKAWAA